MIRDATLDDLDALVEVENRCFDSDRLSRRNFRYLLTKGNAETVIVEDGGVIRGYAMLLFNTGTSLARMYSLAVDPAQQRKGIASALLRASEDSARAHDAVTLRLEIRKDNAASIGLFKRHGYREFGIYTDYYEDHMDAVRFEKSLVQELEPAMARVPFYEQTLDFTCGPSAVMMAMKALDPAIVLRSVPVTINYGALGVDALQERFEQGGIPIVLISSYRIYHEKFPHWVV